MSSYVLLLTGGIGSGKSCAIAHLASRGACVVDLDDVTHEALHEPQVIEALVERFGSQIVGEDGQVVRKRLANLAFVDEESTQALNSITHPVITRRLSDYLKTLKSQVENKGSNDNPQVIAVEVQVAEAIDPAIADEVMTLACPCGIRRERAYGRGMTYKDFDRRDGFQIPDDHRIALAHTVIDASGDMADVIAALDAWWDERERQGWASPSLRERVETPTPVEQPAGLPSPTIAFVGRHNSGKTTMVVRVISELVGRGIDVGSVKHHGHAGFDIDVKGKDSWRHRHAGASEVAISAPDQFALIRSISCETTMEDTVRQMAPHDVVVIEGYRHSVMPCIEVIRAANVRDRAAGEVFVRAVEAGEPFAFDPAEVERELAHDADRLPNEHTVAVLSDMPRVRAAAAKVGMRPFEIDDVAGVCDFIEREIVGSLG